jgi:hypothetical protein
VAASGLPGQARCRSSGRWRYLYIVQWFTSYASLVGEGRSHRQGAPKIHPSHPSHPTFATLRYLSVPFNTGRRESGRLKSRLPRSPEFQLRQSWLEGFPSGGCQPLTTSYCLPVVKATRHCFPWGKLISPRDSAAMPLWGQGCGNGFLRCSGCIGSDRCFSASFCGKKFRLCFLCVLCVLCVKDVRLFTKLKFVLSIL